ncbi:MAG: hypothetical protein KDH96_03940 [Candidatus Riesia sp.]|nr:hypothetical protein [Candidatus Riesia sp.]
MSNIFLFKHFDTKPLLTRNIFQKHLEGIPSYNFKLFKKYGIGVGYIHDLTVKRDEEGYRLIVIKDELKTVDRA